MIDSMLNYVVVKNFIYLVGRIGNTENAGSKKITLMQIKPLKPIQESI